jgi:hypothetical protein
MTVWHFPRLTAEKKSRQVDQPIFYLYVMLKFQLGGTDGLATVLTMENVERTAIEMMRRYGNRDAAIQQAHAYDSDAMTDDDRAFWRGVLAELRSYGACNAAE